MKGSWMAMVAGLLLCAVCAALPAHSAELLLTDSARGQDASTSASFWRDATASADLAAAMAADRRGKFSPTHGITAFGIDPAPHWFRLDLRRPADGPDTWWLEIPHPGLDDVRLYLPGEAGTAALYAVGDHRPFAARPLEHRNFLLPLHLPAERSVTLYLRVQTADTLTVPLRIWNPTRFNTADHREITLIGVYYGLILAMLVYNLFLYLRLRDRVFASYLAFSAVILLVVAELDGQAFEYLWPNNLWLADRQHVILPAAAILAALAFMRRLFELRQSAPRLDQAIAGLNALTVLALAIGLFADYTLGHVMLLLLLPLQSIVGIVAGVGALRRGYRPARYYLLAQACFQGSVLAVVGNALGVWSTPLLIAHAIGIGSALEVMLFSQALAERIAALRLEKEVAMRRAAQAEAASAAKSRILAAVSHDLRQPILALGLFLDALARRADDEAESALVGKMDATVRALSELIETYLGAAQLDSGVIVPQPRPIAVSTLFERLIGEFELQAEAAGLRLAVRLPRADAVVATDPGLLLTLLRNLVANALRYTERGGLILGCRRRDGQVLLQVWDSGHGIAADEQERIFGEFYRGGPALRDGHNGLGLGLHIAGRIAALLGSRIQLRSRPGRGSVFELALPLAALPTESDWSAAQ